MQKDTKNIPRKVSSGYAYAQGVEPVLKYTLEKTIKGGYLKKSKNFKPLNRDLTGKTILITGGNSGIGLDAACLLGSLGANVHIACRSKERGEAAVNQIKEKSKETLNFLLFKGSSSKNARS